MNNHQKNFAKQALRRASLRWKPRNNVKTKNRKKITVTSTTKTGKTMTKDIWHYQCAMCPSDKWHRDKDMQMDHVLPVEDTISAWQGFDIFIERLLVDESGWQLLCHDHHQEKSNSENSVRRVIKNVKKKRK